MSNIVIIGSGPAGVSAALYTARAGVDTTILTRGPGALDRAELIQNYYGFAAPISGAELERQGIEGAKAVGVKFVTTEAVGLTYTDKLTVETTAAAADNQNFHLLFLRLYSLVPPPISTTMLPVGSATGRPAPIAAAMGSSIR